MMEHKQEGSTWSEQQMNINSLEYFEKHWSSLYTNAQQNPTPDNLERCKELLTQCLVSLPPRIHASAYKSIIQLENQIQKAKPKKKFQFSKQS